MKTRGQGGTWNRAGRRAGGERPAPLEAPFTPTSWVDWLRSVGDLVRLRLGVPLEALMGRVTTVKELEAWYDAGERASWVAATLIDREKKAPKEAK